MSNFKLATYSIIGWLFIMLFTACLAYSIVYLGTRAYIDVKEPREPVNGLECVYNCSDYNLMLESL